MDGQEANGTIVTWLGVGLTQTPMSIAQFIGIVIGLFGFSLSAYSVVTRNRHNKFMRELAEKKAGKR